jgi:hypothetical protein
MSRSCRNLLYKGSVYISIASLLPSHGKRIDVQCFADVLFGFGYTVSNVEAVSTRRISL